MGGRGGGRQERKKPDQPGQHNHCDGLGAGGREGARGGGGGEKREKKPDQPGQHNHCMEGWGGGGRVGRAEKSLTNLASTTTVIWEGGGRREKKSLTNLASTTIVWGWGVGQWAEGEKKLDQPGRHNHCDGQSKQGPLGNALYVKRTHLEHKHTPWD